MGFVVCFANNKGGSGKSTVTFNLGIALARMGKKILFIDLDSQANLTSLVSKTHPMNTQWEKTIEDAFRDVSGGLPVCHTDDTFVDFVPADLDLSNFDNDMARESFRDLLLQDLLDGTKDDYDFVLIDCPPALSSLTNNALVASDYLYIVASPDTLGFRGAQMMLGSFEFVKSNKRLNPKLKLGGCIIDKYKNEKDCKVCIEQFKKLFGLKLLQPFIREAAVVRQAITAEQSLFDFDPKNKICGVFVELARNIALNILTERW